MTSTVLENICCANGETMQGILDCKSGIKDVYAVDQLILVVTQGGLYTVPLDVGR